MIRLLLFFIGAGLFTPARADFLLKHSLQIGAHRYVLVMILPDYFIHHFGAWGELDYELHEQALAPVPEARISEWKGFLQRTLWTDYELSPLLQGQSLWEPRFNLFRFAETFDDKRSAIYAILKARPGLSNDDDLDELAPTAEIFQLKALLRLTSPIDTPEDAPFFERVKSLMPWEIRGIYHEPAELEAVRDKKWVSAESKEQTDGVACIFIDPENGLGCHKGKQGFYWFEGAPLELKAWYHKPESIVINSPAGRERLLIDFLPDLLQISQMYGGFERTGLTLADFEHLRSDCPKILESIRKATGHKVTAKDIGIRAGQFWSEVVDDNLVQQEIDLFRMQVRRTYPDPDFNGRTTRILWAEKQTILPALSAWAAKRPGASLLPLTKILLKKTRDRPCRQIVDRFGAPIWNHRPDAVGFALSLK
jgi:hypothetical protein